MSKRIILSDSSLNRYGYRVLTSGMDITAFKKNPVMLYMHLRDEGSPIWGESKAIGHWEDIQIDGDVLSAVPVFDCVDELSTTIKKKFEAGTYNAASVGIKILGTSNNKDLLVPGQTRETVTKCDLMEASIVDVPANGNAVRLYEKDSNSVYLATGMDKEVVPEIKRKGMNLKSTWITVLALLGIAADKAESTELSAENIEALDNEMSRLTAENSTLVDAKKDVDEKLKNSQEEVTTLKSDITNKDAEIGTLKSSVEGKDKEIATLKKEVETLKSTPPVDNGGIAPKGEHGEEGKDDLAAFCQNFKGGHAEMAAKLAEEGLI